MPPQTRAARKSSPRNNGIVHRQARENQQTKRKNSERNTRSGYDGASEKPTQDQEILRKQQQRNEELVLDNSDSEDEEEEDEIFELDGKRYSTYQEMVDAKRQKNQTFMAEEGLLRMIVKPSKKRSPPKPKVPQEASRQSKRLKGVQAERVYVEEERGGRVSIGGMFEHHPDGDKETTTAAATPQERFYGDRINDGSDMTVAEAVSTIGVKWFVKDASIPQAEAFMKQIQSLQRLRSPKNNKQKSSGDRASPTSVRIGLDSEADGDDDSSESFSSSSLSKQIERLSLGGLEPGIYEQAATEGATVKLVPERIYSVATHPSTDRLLVCAGDKAGFVGIWNVPSSSSSFENLTASAVENFVVVDRESPSSLGTDETRHLFRFHTQSVTSMEWTGDGQSLLTTSYDSTCRLWNAQTQTFQQVFASYDDDPSNSHHPGRGLDDHRGYFQSSSLDHRNPSDAFFLSTSFGTALHIDMRLPKRVTWNVELSKRKINTVSLHPNGYSFLSSGLDCCVSLWDLRKFGNATSKAKPPTAIATHRCSRSVNSAYFSPVTGRNVVVTTMYSGIDMLRDFHLASSKTTLSSKKNYGQEGPAVVQNFKHDNATGRWLSTFMARWHPSVDDLFCVGSMEKPRNIHVYNTEQQLAAIPGLTAVMSRCCFHPSTNELILVGGNSSGRVSLVRERKL